MEERAEKGVGCSRRDESVLHLYGEARPEFKAHLAQCPECSEFVRDSRQVLDLYRSVSREEFLAFPRPEAGRSRRNRTWVGLAVAASLAFAIGLVYVSMWNGPGTPPERESVDALVVDHDISRLAYDTSRVFYDDDSSLVIDDQLKEIKNRIGVMNDADAF